MTRREKHPIPKVFSPFREKAAATWLLSAKTGVASGWHVLFDICRSSSAADTHPDGLAQTGSRKRKQL